jgi:hypothetical protein
MDYHEITELDPITCFLGFVFKSIIDISPPIFKKAHVFQSHPLVMK